jgi:triacylglycerol esterase/lipase EstA (alpha/beta hydrolase family)
VQPILFEECYAIAESQEFLDLVKSTSAVKPNSMKDDTKEKDGTHLFVMVHGFQGNHNDLRGMRNQIALHHPKSLFLLSVSNEEKTEDTISEMGERLAKEIKKFVIEFCPGSNLGKLSFVGFSLGGLIARAAFPHLEHLATKFYTFISLSSPHLGYMYNSNKLFETGMWFIRKWNKSKSLTQLSMQDGASVEQSCLYKMSSWVGMSWFENVVLVCSNQDQYVPFDSARIQICKEALTDSNTSDANRGN